MCAVIMTIIRQSINNHPDTYAWISYNNEIWSQKIHGVASDTSPSVQWSRNVLRDITSLVAEQKQFIDSYLLWIQWSTVSDSISIGTDSIQTWPIVDIKEEPELPTIPEYIPFEQIKKSLADKKCEYQLPIDNTDPKIAPHIQWWLEHCLITVSASQKVYPNDILTHEMMRIIADRAWFSVKMDYASRKTVSREQFLTFFYTLQQHHQIGDLPVVSMSTPLKRSEYLIFLHKLFGDAVKSIAQMTWVVSTGTTVWSLPQISKHTISDMTVKEFKQMLIAQGQQITITAYDESIILTPDIMKTIVSEIWDTNHPISSSVWIDKEMMKQTLSWFIEKL